MSLEALTTEPASIYCGDTINWIISLSDYPATGGWTLKYKAVSAAGYIAIVATASGADHQVSVPMATTDDYLPGDYTLVKYVESATERVTISQTAFKVYPFLAGKTAAFDNRTINEQILAALDAAILGSASSDQLEITIDGTTIKRMTRQQLGQQRNGYALSVWQERNPGQLAPSINLCYRDRYAE